MALTMRGCVRTSLTADHSLAVVVDHDVPDGGHAHRPSAVGGKLFHLHQTTPGGDAGLGVEGDVHGGLHPEPGDPVAEISCRLQGHAGAPGELAQTGLDLSRIAFPSVRHVQVDDQPVQPQLLQAWQRLPIQIVAVADHHQAGSRGAPIVPTAAARISVDSRGPHGIGTTSVLPRSRSRSSRR